MRFITEFELKEADYIKLSYIINEQKGRHTKELGKEIGDTFGFQNPVNNNNLHHKLEIEAFPMDKWIEFKQKLFSEMQQSAIYGIAINALKVLEMIKDLEFYSNDKKSVDELPNN